MAAGNGLTLLSQSGAEQRGWFRWMALSERHGKQSAAGASFAFAPQSPQSSERRFLKSDLALETRR
jgi:hypothetical protein